MYNTLQSFPPVIDSTSHTLILGSMPGRVSLSESQYYAHPRNAFWHIMGALYGAGFDRPYQERLSILLAHGIALWDVIGECTRYTSLDADIDESSIIPNDFVRLLLFHPRIRRIFFNGGKAEQAFKKLVRSGLGDSLDTLSLQKLTSTSPANARHSILDKTEMWRIFLDT